MKLLVKNWRDFQHYKDRAPPWIKLHRGLLDDADFHALPVESQALLPMLWLLAAETDGSIKNDIRWLAFRLRKTEEAIEAALGPLLDGGFFLPGAGEEAPKEKWPSRYIPAAIRAAVMERDSNKCCSCGAEDNLEVDHKLPVSRGGTSVEDNLQVLCRSCNRSKRLRTAEQFATQKNVSRRTETEVETEKEREKEVEKRNGSRFALTQLPIEWFLFAEQERPDLDPASLFAKFGDYWRGVPGARGRKSDWDATWRNFVRTERRQPDWAKPKQSPEQVAAEALKMMEARDAQARTA